MLNYRSLELDSRGGKEKGETKEELKDKLRPLFFTPLSQYFAHPSHDFPASFNPKSTVSFPTTLAGVLYLCFFGLLGSSKPLPTPF